MSREVIKYKFNRNHVSIYTIRNPEGRSLDWACPRYDTKTTCCRTNIVDPNRTKKQKTGKDYEEIKMESPLGFYYYKRKYFPKFQEVIDKDSYRTINTVSFIDTENVIHILKFYTQYGENKAAGTEDGLRPWEICEGDNAMPDHMLTALWEDVNSFFNEMEAYGIDKVYFTTGYIHSDLKRNYPIYKVKQEVCEYLFGSVKGIRFQTDMEKLIAHGFDPKYSFRKDKEKK